MNKPVSRLTRILAKLRQRVHTRLQARGHNSMTWWPQFLNWRRQTVNQLLSRIYGQPMQVLPRGHVGLAGAVVLWYLQDGFKQFVMVRTPDGSNSPGDGRARFISCLGLGHHPSLTVALRAVLEGQAGRVFARTLPTYGTGTDGDTAKGEIFASDRVAAAPVFNYTDEATGITSPVQALVWVVQIQPAQVELIEAGGGIQTVMVPEFALSSQKVSPTHRALWQAVQRHIPKGRMLREAAPVDEAAAEEAIKDISSGGGGGHRVLH